MFSFFILKVDVKVVQQSRFILSKIFEPLFGLEEVSKEMFGSKGALKHAYHTIDGKVFLSQLEIDWNLLFSISIM